MAHVARFYYNTWLVSLCYSLIFIQYTGPTLDIPFFTARLFFNYRIYETLFVAAIDRSRESQHSHEVYLE